MVVAHGCNKRSRMAANTLASEVVLPRELTVLGNSRRGRTMHTHLLSRLSKLLQLLPSERRRAVLAQSLSEPQRKALEMWLLASKLQLPTKSSVTRCASLAKEKKTAPCSAKAISGLVRNPQKNGTYYWAQVGVGSLQLMSRAHRDQRLALRVRDALLCIRQRALDCGHDLVHESASEQNDFPVVFRKAIFEVLQEHGLDAMNIGLRFFVSLKPLWATRRLCTRPYTVPTEMEMGLQAWRRLTAAKGEVRRRSHVLRLVSPLELEQERQKFHTVYSEVMAEAGCCQRQLLSRLEALKIEQHGQQERQAEAWNRSRMAANELRQRLAEKSVERDERKRRTVIAAERAIQQLVRQWGLQARPSPRGAHSGTKSQRMTKCIKVQLSS